MAMHWKFVLNIIFPNQGRNNKRNKEILTNFITWALSQQKIFVVLLHESAQFQVGFEGVYICYFLLKVLWNIMIDVQSSMIWNKGNLANVFNLIFFSLICFIFFCFYLSIFTSTWSDIINVIHSMILIKSFYVAEM